jgi:hypothetical protein
MPILNEQVTLILNLYIVYQNILITVFQHINDGASSVKMAVIHQFTTSKSSYRYMFWSPCLSFNTTVSHKMALSY